jgi:hypothetical protein
MFSFIFKRSFFTDRLTVVMGIAVVALLLVNLGLVLFNLESRSYPVAIRYSDFSASILERDGWRNLYALPLFSLVITMANLAVAVKAHNPRRDIAIGVLSATLFIGLVNLIVSWSLLSLL